VKPKSPAFGASDVTPETGDIYTFVRDRQRMDMVNEQLKAYILDRDPRHVFRAFRIARHYKMPIQESLLKWLDLALDENAPKPRKLDAMRYMELVNRACAYSDTRSLPDKLAPDVLARLKQDFPGVPVSEHLHRVRKYWRDRADGWPRLYLIKAPKLK